jgi:pimeloyl-ACP methyl ester carboxylesterase
MYSLLLAAIVAIANPCASAKPECTEWITVDGKQSKLLIYRSYSLASRNERITRALVFVHGINRDADNHFRTALAAAFLDGALTDTVIVAPRFASNSVAPGNEAGHCADSIAADEANWYCENQRPDTWRSGGQEVSHAEVASFDFMDEILRRLSDKQVFPKLHTIVVAGHSAGGQFVSRYEMTSGLGNLPGISISYVVANPSSYAYLDALRPTASALPLNISAWAPGFRPPPPTIPPPPFVEFADARYCTGFDDWPYGLKNRRGYAARVSEEQIRAQASSRPVTYLLGDSDILPSGIFDVSCAAMAQGPTRLARGLAFGKYMKDNFGAHHDIVVVPFCGHSARCLLTADIAMSVIFPK